MLLQARNSLKLAAQKDGDCCGIAVQGYVSGW